MAKTFEEWMAANGLATGYGANYLYGQNGTGGAGDRSTAVLNWQREQSAGALSDLLASANQKGNAFGAVPAVDTGNRFESGLSDTESRLRALLDDPDSIKQSAAYKFRVGQGQEALQRSLGAKGLLNSGNRLMELTKYGQDMGSQEYDAQAGRLGSLLGTYGQGYLGDKNANTSRFSAEAGAFNTAQGNADTNRYRMGSLAWDMQKPQATGRTTTSGMTLGNSFNPGGIGGNTPVDWNAFDAKQRAERDYLDRY